jgi:hypothetical protein
MCGACKWSASPTSAGDATCDDIDKVKTLALFSKAARAGERTRDLLIFIYFSWLVFELQLLASIWLNRSINSALGKNVLIFYGGISVVKHSFAAMLLKVEECISLVPTNGL